mgnify:CR=1 FL=1
MCKKLFNKITKCFHKKNPKSQISKFCKWCILMLLKYISGIKDENHEASHKLRIRSIFCMDPDHSIYLHAVSDYKKRWSEVLWSNISSWSFMIILVELKSMPWLQLIIYEMIYMSTSFGSYYFSKFLLLAHQRHLWTTGLTLKL